MSYDSFVRQSEEILREASSSWAEDQRCFIRHAVRRLGPNVVVNAKLFGDERFCAAKNRRGYPCLNRVLPGKDRCKFHGGASTGPKTEAGKEAIRESNRRRSKSASEADTSAAQSGKILEDGQMPHET